jgi:DNA (cytosine-5)-methyltransferase 1
VGELNCNSLFSEEMLPIKLASVSDLGALGRSKQNLLDTASWRSIHKHRRKFDNWGIAFKGSFFSCDLSGFSLKTEKVVLADVLESRVSDDFDFTESTLDWIANNTEVNRFVHGVEILSNQKGGARMGYTIFGVNGIAPTLTSTTSRHYERYKIGDRYRRLTNVEYARIQGFPDDHCAKLSVYDQYALYGNAVPPPMAQWVLKRLKAPLINYSDLPKQFQTRSLFDYAE